MRYPKNFIRDSSKNEIYFRDTIYLLEVDAVSGKVLTPFFAMVLLLSMAVNLAPQQTPSLQGGIVHGFLEDLFGSSSEEIPDVTVSITDGATGGRMYMQITGINGEATDKDHKDWIEVLSFSMGMADPIGGATGSTRRRGDVVIEDIVVVKELDKSSPKLMEKCAMGGVIPSLVLEVCCEAEGSSLTYYKYELENVMVTSFYCVGSTADDVPVETVTLNYEEITVTYTEIDSEGKSKGNVEFTWKVEEAETS
jgi:type VI secretion system secreted protein Hcp